ncbi:MAG: TrkH family potassium uptake protein [Solirubrobacterales bacterium]
MLGKTVATKPALTPAQAIVLGFAFAILGGAVALWMPFSVRSGHFNNFIDALFTSTTAVCVTGLVTVDTGSFYNNIGHAIVLFLIQIGGLGIITATTMYALISGKRIGLRERILIKESLNRESLGGVVRLVRAIVITTVIIEGTGAALLFFFLRGEGVPPLKALWWGAFHSISAFCNAGIDLFGKDYAPYCSLIPFQNNEGILLTIALLIIFGGIGFIVLLKMMQVKNWRKLSVHAKLALTATGILLALGTIFFYFTESGNTFAHMGLSERLTNAFFMSVTPRTAGYAAVDFGKVIPSSLLMIMILMFIGAAPGGTGGGIKVTTFSVLVLAVWARMRNREDIELFDRRLDKGIVYNALTVITLAGTVVIACVMLLTLVDPHDPIKLMFEAFSAFGTVGLTTGITPELTDGAKLILIFLMFFGRLGPLTMAFALMEKTKTNNIKYPKGTVMIG